MADLAEVEIAVREKEPIDKITRGFEDLNREYNRLEQSSREVQAGSRQTAPSLLAVGAAAGVAVTGLAALGIGARAAFGFVASSIATAREAQGSLDHLSDAAVRAGSAYAAQRGEFVAYADELEAATGTARASILGIQAELLDLRVGRDALDELTAGVLDYAAARDKSLGAAQSTIEKAIRGQTGALRELGVEIDATATREQRAAAVAEALAASYGGASYQLDEFGGKLDRLGLGYTRLQRSIGGVVTESAAANDILLSAIEVVSTLEGSVDSLADQKQRVDVFFGSVASGSLDAAAAVLSSAATIARGVQEIQQAVPGLSALATAGMRFGPFGVLLPDSFVSSVAELENVGPLVDRLSEMEAGIRSFQDSLQSRSEMRAFVAGVDDISASFKRNVDELKQLREEHAALKSPSAVVFDSDVGAIDIVGRTQEVEGAIARQVSMLQALGSEYRERGQQIPADVREMAAAVGVDLPRAAAAGSAGLGELGKASREAAAGVRKYRSEVAELTTLLDHSDPFIRAGVAEAARADTLALLDLAAASRVAHDAERARLAEAEEVAAIARRFRQEGATRHESALQLRLSVRPEEALQSRLRELDALAAAHPDIITPEVRSDLFIEEARRIQNAGRETADVVGQAFDGMATRLEDSLVGALETGRFEVREFGKAVLLDLAQLSIREGVTKPLFNSLAGAVQEAREVSAARGAISRAGFTVDDSGGAGNVLAGLEAGADRFADASEIAAARAGTAWQDVARQTGTGFLGVISSLGGAVGSLFSLIGGSRSSSFGEAIGWGALSGLAGGIISVGAGALGGGGGVRTSPSGAVIDSDGDFFPAVTSRAQSAAFDAVPMSVSAPTYDTRDSWSGYTYGGGADYYRPPMQAPAATQTIKIDREPVAFNVNISATALDARGVKEQVLGVMPEIHAQVKNALLSGDRGYRQAIKTNTGVG